MRNIYQQEADATLVERYQKGNKEALVALLERYDNRMNRMFVSRGCEPEALLIMKEKLQEHLSQKLLRIRTQPFSFPMILTREFEYIKRLDSSIEYFPESPSLEE